MLLLYLELKPLSLKKLASSFVNLVMEIAFVAIHGARYVASDNKALRSRFLVHNLDNPHYTLDSA